MKPIKYSQLDCQTLADALRGKVEVIEVANFTGLVPHVGYGGTSKSRYVSPKTGKTVYVLERNGWYAPDAYLVNVWQFDTDFTLDDARGFLQGVDLWKTHEDAREIGQLTGQPESDVTAMVRLTFDR